MTFDEKLNRAIAKHKRAIERAKRDVAVLTNKLRALQGETEVQCLDDSFGKGCGRETKINQVEYIQTMYYVMPFGCNGGDYYRPGEGRFVCPHCGHINRLYDRQEIEALRMSFKAIREERSRE